MTVHRLQQLLLLLIIVATLLIGVAFFVAGFPLGALLPLLSGGWWFIGLRQTQTAPRDRSTLGAVLLIMSGAVAVWFGERGLPIVYVAVGFVLVGWQLSLGYGRLQRAPHTSGVPTMIAVQLRRSALFFLVTMLALPLWLLLPTDLNFDTVLLLAALLVTGAGYLIRQLRQQDNASPDQ